MTAPGRETGQPLSALASALVLLIASAPALAGEADVVDAAAQCTAGSCRFSVTVRHDDTGWDHYADHWRVLGPDGRELGRRVLYHPHVGEQPFTRSLDAVAVEALEHVVIEAHDSSHGYGGRRHELALPR